MIKFALLGRLDSLVMGVHGLLQLASQLIPILPEGLDFGHPLLCGLPQLLHLFTQTGSFQAALLRHLLSRLEIGHNLCVGSILLLQLGIIRGDEDRSRQLLLQAGTGGGIAWRGQIIAKLNYTRGKQDIKAEKYG